MREYLITALIAAAVTYLFVPIARYFAIKIGAAPEVRERDVHTVPTPRLGGLAIYVGLVASLLFANSLPHTGGLLAHSDTVIAVILSGGILVIIGFFDDWWGIDPLIKLGGQVAAAGVLVNLGVALPWLPLPNGAAASMDSGLSTVITILVVVIVINAINFIDGLDGLAVGIVGIAAMAMWSYSIILSQHLTGQRIATAAIISAVLIGVCAGFLPHNTHPARIFMGDTGSMLIAMVLATATISVTSGVDPYAIDSMNRFPVVLPLLLPVGVMAVPLIDLFTALVRRTSHGMSPFAADRGHLHHRLLDIGHSHRRTVMIMHGWALLFSATVVGLAAGGVPVLIFPVVVLAAITLLVVMAAPRQRRGRSHSRIAATNARHRRGTRA
ncbi:undecaprenyl/decaprenyl-phosphate alpha-N-acetylglucosaminyl 1-phosphate transferase [Spongiactinospora rosea]|uniref:Undecaprenyl/decaprenyl-phosphate alpha-N-acetylglucosaminyl 1-phosphate transferase n=1 Tax=Spongiactinospora rosea TaxID=2248750 RepID=A0A366LMN4_9ACTN|nr:MraY family glycosyltransferase [Spongiactinospora rosea]RBQ14920.1 undecaprenyl/decaprenyl-phosphate alpha-N-acetylglucosaminyl 1-phosphate transferase [Spongiactinospora rosea]